MTEASRLSRRTLATIRGICSGRFAYHLAALAPAAAGLLTSDAGSAAVAASSVFVVGNSLWPCRLRPGAGGEGGWW